MGRGRRDGRKEGRQVLEREQGRDRGIWRKGRQVFGCNEEVKGWREGEKTGVRKWRMDGSGQGRGDHLPTVS